MITSEMLGVSASLKGASPTLKIDLHRESNTPAFIQICNFFFTAKYKSVMTKVTPWPIILARAAPAFPD